MVHSIVVYALAVLHMAYQVYKKKMDDTTAENSGFQRPFQRWRGELLAKSGPKAKKRKTTTTTTHAASRCSRPAPVLPDGDPTEAEVRSCLPPVGYKVYQDCSNNRCHIHYLIYHVLCCPWPCSFDFLWFAYTHPITLTGGRWHPATAAGRDHGACAPPDKLLWTFWRLCGRTTLSPLGCTAMWWA